ncbi:MAG: glycosyltransferase family 4 protein [Candidatus Omnitrophica bacterium]|nr:glycosyltransferase family 4 protein [Candidatus Omnitrophota bacterium]
MKIAFVCFYRVFPPTFGSAALTYQFFQNLRAEKLLIQIDTPRNKQSLAEGTPVFNLCTWSHRWYVKWVFILIQIPVVVRLLQTNRPDTIIIEGGSWVVYAALAFASLSHARVKAKVIYHAHNVEYLLRKKKNNILIACVTRWAEGYVMRHADTIVAVSSIDAAHFQRLYQIQAQVNLPAVSLDTFAKVTPAQINSVCRRYGYNGNSVLFMGLQAYKPNRQALDFLISQVFPQVLRSIPDAQLVVIGGKVLPRRSWLVNPGIVPFEDMPALISSAAVCTAPVFSGSGVRIKILEYMAAARPVVATTKAKEGLLVSDGEDIYLADSAVQFAEKIVYVLRNEEPARKIGRAARETIALHYDGNNIKNRGLLHLWS